MTTDINANDVVAFFVELGVFALLAWAGWRASPDRLLKILLGVGVPVLAAVLWGLFAAPFAVFQSEPLRLLTKLLVLGSGSAAGFILLRRPWAVGFAVVVATNLLLMYVGPFARRAG